MLSRARITMEIHMLQAARQILGLQAPILNAEKIRFCSSRTYVVAAY